MNGRQVTKIPKDIVKIIQQGKDFVLLTHVHPDGDALGSQLAMAEILKGLGKNVICFGEAPVSHLLDFLPESNSICSDLDEIFRFIANAQQGVVTISLDCGEGARLGRHEVSFLNNKPFLVIDHHKSHEKHGDYRWVEPGRSSTGEMVYELAKALGAEISPEAAFDLYVAIVTDTGSFRYEATSARTLAIASDLVGLGVRPEEVASKIYDNYSRQRLKLMELVLETLTLHENDQLAVITATEHMFTESGATYEDVDGFVDYPRSIKSVKVAAFIKEAKDGAVSVSLRAKGDCDVTVIAKAFNGGGHRNAAGFRLANKSSQQVKEEVLVALREALYSGK